MENAYPEFDMFDELPSYGFYVRHGENISFSDISINTKNEDERPAIVLSDLQFSAFRNMSLESSSKGICSVKAEDCKGIIFSGNRIKGNSNCFLSLKGNTNNDISIVGNLLNNSNLVFKTDPNIVVNVNESGNIK